MNKKGWTKILIVIVACLWGYNIYRTVENYNAKTESQEVQQNTVMNFAPVIFNKDTFDLDLPSQDPFLRGNGRWGHNSSFQNSGTNQNNANNRPPVLPKTPTLTKVNWPTIKYYGFLRNRQENHQLCMLGINDQNYRLSVGESKKEVQIIQAFQDSIILIFNNEQKTFLK